MDIRYHNISDLFVVVGDSKDLQEYNITDLKITMALGSRAECQFEVTSAISDFYDASSVAVNTSTEELHKKFKYGQLIRVYQHLDSTAPGDTIEGILLFRGYILHVGTSFISGPNEIIAKVTITLVTGSTLYNNEAVVQPYYLRNDGKTLPESAFASWKIPEKPRAKLKEAGGSIDVVKYTADLIDAFSDLRKGTWPAGKTQQVFSTIAEVVDLINAPVLNWKIRNPEFLARSIEQQVSDLMQRRPGITVFENVIANFFMITAPRVDRLSIVPNTGIAKQTKSLSSNNILGYQLYPAQYRENKYTAVATTLPGRQDVIYALILGHDAEGKPVAKEYHRENVNELIAKAAKSGTIVPYGALSYIPMPMWVELINKENKSSKKGSIESEYYELARAITKGSIATGGGFSGRMVIGVLPSHYAEICNSIGEVFKIDFTNRTTGVNAIRYGRLIDINYNVNATKDSLSSSLTLAFDCILTQEEYSKFSIDPATVGFIKK